MPWFKVDDGWNNHPKVIGLSWAAKGLWVHAGSWSAQHGTDGRIPEKVVAHWRVEPKLVRELVVAELWLAAKPDGWQFHQWLDYQPSRAEVDAKKASATERKRRSRARENNGVTHQSRVTVESVTRDTQTLSHDSRPVPTRPVKISAETSSKEQYTNLLLRNSVAQARGESGRGGELGSSEFSEARAEVEATLPATDPPTRQEQPPVLALVPQMGVPAEPGLTGAGIAGMTWYANLVRGGDTLSIPPYGFSRQAYDYIGSRPVSERDAVAKHVRATQWCLDNWHQVSPAHVVRCWAQYVVEPRNPKPSAATSAAGRADAEADRISAQIAATRSSFEQRIRDARGDDYQVTALRAERDLAIPRLEAKLAEARSGGGRRRS